MKLWSGCGFCWGCFSHFMGPSADDDFLRVASYPPPSTLSACGFSAVIPHLCMPQAPPVVPDLSVRSFPVKCSFFPSILMSFRWKKVVYLIWCLMLMVYCNDSVTSWISVVMGWPHGGMGPAALWRRGLKELFWGCWIILFTLGSAPNWPYLL